ncbi:hypothetical protein SmJEL517_g04805 [Synchytrium microbalum]|uniref:Mitochondrial import inner membrane translocase subunit TIM17 n=1 Tax=Synchytrium microbalum TaxID=1806994 RepID=A0A507C214_9FUNG|nr:uncharacterized protein SmJEL517_g04805 [Synchytrium microbalum]TPX31996.1 hypothetical protein SmJEL517_g04805 [Synchytrium microbalum]
MSQGHDRDPCPYVIINDCGGAFAMGSIGGALWHSFKGYRNSPRGERFSGAITAIKARAPVLGGNFAVWGGLFSTFDCTIAAIRQKEDPWNSIASGAAAGAVLSARAGPRAAAMSAVVGGVLLALMEGIGIAIGRASAGAFKPVAPIIPDLPAVAPTAPLSPYADGVAHSSSNSKASSDADKQDAWLNNASAGQGEGATPLASSPPAQPQPPAKPKGRFGFI